MRAEIGSKSTDQNGFTLLEVLVAFTVLTLTLTAVLQIFSGGLRNSVTTRDYASALTLAQSQIARIGQDIPLRVGRQNGSDASGYAWQHAIARKSAADGLILYDVAVTVTVPDGSRSVKLRTQKLERLP